MKTYIGRRTAILVWLSGTAMAALFAAVTHFDSVHHVVKLSFADFLDLVFPLSVAAAGILYCSRQCGNAARGWLVRFLALFLAPVFAESVALFFSNNFYHLVAAVPGSRTWVFLLGLMSAAIGNRWILKPRQAAKLNLQTEVVVNVPVDSVAQPTGWKAEPVSQSNLLVRLNQRK